MPDPQVPPIGVSALIRFAGEIGMLAALAYVGAVLADGVLAVASAVVLPVAAATAWGAFVGPRANRRWPDPARLLLELVLFGAACAGLVVSGAWPWAVALAVAYALGLPHRRAEAKGHNSRAS
ncbi:YrdB family protein [Solicola gregarius]|uniref:YrdB family protein n=1 Tax=Solicola gregarius TaxID=2908642 RepID=A0AA46TGS5_9ACTN|nr:YrdB family protein [Solicola gregarius]UYM04517.1 YrdB family protein [Solicola gregarius]